MSDVNEVVARLAEPGSGGSQQLVNVALSDPDALPELVAVAVAAFTNRSSVGIDAALDLLPYESLSAVADDAVGALRGGADRRDSQAASLIAQLSLQAPDSLEKHLGELWTLRPNSGTYYELWPWRAAHRAGEVDVLIERLGAADPELRRRAMGSLLETRTDDAWRAALEAVDTRLLDGFEPATMFGLVGVALLDGRFHRLFHEATCHIEFPHGFLVDPGWSGVDGTLPYPSWHPGTEVLGRAVFGGEGTGTCKVCGQALHRLLRFDETPASVPSGLDVVTCLSCLGWSVPILFFTHASGEALPARWEVPTQEPEFPADALPEVEVELVRTPARWRLQDWGLSNGRQNLHRVGGEPTWIQSPEFPICPGCNQTMRFLLQLDSMEIRGGPWWLWGSGGILYAFWCERCSTTATTWQCT